MKRSHLNITIIVIAWLIVHQPAEAGDDLDQALALLDQLDRQRVTVAWNETRLSAAIAELAGRLEMPVRADWDALERIGVRDDDRIDLTLAQARGSTVLAGLTLLLGDEFDRPTFEAFAGQIVLTTHEATASMRMTDVYDVRDLLRNDAAVERLRATAAPARSEASTAESSNGDASYDESMSDGETEPGGKIKRTDQPEETPDDDEEDQDEEPAHDDSPWALPAPVVPDATPRRAELRPGEELIRLITNHVDPEAWMNYGGSVALMSDHAGAVLVSAPATVHRRLRRTLALLREADPAGVAIDAAVVEAPRAALKPLMRRYDAASALLGRSLIGLPQSTVMWRSMLTVAMDEQARVESVSDASQFTLTVEPAHDEETGRLTMHVIATSMADNDTRSIDTIVFIPEKLGGAVLELPAATPGDKARYLILLPDPH
jgi:hypothetical protein